MSDFFEKSWGAAGRASAALVLALALHAGAVLAILHAATPDTITYDDAGPIAIELAPLPAAPASPRIDAPVGPAAEETPQSVPMTPTRAEQAKVEEAPPLPTTPYNPEDLDLQMAKPSPKKEKEETPQDDKTTDAIEQPPAPSSVAVPETTAPPPSAEPPAPVAAAPDAGLSESDKQTIARWQRKVVVHLNKFKQYPPDARGRGAQGDVRLIFRIDRTGHVLASRIVAGSGSISLDRAALQILDHAGLLPTPPPQVAGSEIELSLPIQYRMKE